MRHTPPVTVSRLRVAKSETRDLADRDRASMRRRLLGEPTDWQLGNRSFFAAFVVILAILAVLALVLR
jgi:hypothetical protein